MASILTDRPAVTAKMGLQSRLYIAGVLLLVALGLWALFLLTARAVYVQVDGMEETVLTHRATVRDLLLDLGIQPALRDRILPGVESVVERNMTLTVERARPVRILADGRDVQASSWGLTPRQLLADAGIVLDTYDEVLLNGSVWGVDQSLPTVTVQQSAPTYDQGFAWDLARAEPLQVRIYRSVPVVVHEDDLTYTIDTTAQTVGEALRRSGVILYLGDRVQPSLGSAVSANLNVYIQRSIPVSLQVDGRVVKTRTRAETVGDALSDLGVVVSGQDRVEPPLETELYDNIKIGVTRVSEDVTIEEEIAPFETVYIADPNLSIDTQEVLAPGAEGITRTRYRERYENNELVGTTLEDRWLAQDPADRRIAYGQRIEPKTETLPDGTVITYWRKIKMLATSYTAASAGGNRTRTGDVVRQGIVAVDPRLIPLRSQVYVLGYGMGDALDTGGGIISRRIDLAFEDANYVSWRRWVDVYLLWPPPAYDDITWVVPNYPPVPQ